MNTPTHFIMTGALKKALPKNWKINGKALLWGSIAPDIPLYLLCLGAFFYYPVFQGMPMPEAANHVFGILYFQDPIWLSLHNFFHSPTNLALLFLLAFVLYKSPYKKIGLWLFWFLSACLLHSIVDILTHHDDGPLLLFPFDLTTRYSSPVSYWDPQYGGRVFARFEFVFAISLLLYWIWPWLKRKVC